MIKYADEMYIEGVGILHSIYLKIKEYIHFCRKDEFQGLHLREGIEGNRILATTQSFFNKLRDRIEEWKQGIKEKISLNIQAINDNTEYANEDSQSIYKIRVGIDDSTKRIYRQLDTSEKRKVKKLCDRYFRHLRALSNLMKPFIERGEDILILWPFEDKEITDQIKEWLDSKN
jgi:hypothetical protein